MKPISVDELPDFLQTEFPGKNLSCIADFARDGIAINHGDREIVLFSEKSFEDEKITDEKVRQTVASWLKQNSD